MKDNSKNGYTGEFSCGTIEPQVVDRKAIQASVFRSLT